MLHAGHAMKPRGGALYRRGRGTYERLELMGQMWAKLLVLRLAAEVTN